MEPLCGVCTLLSFLCGFWICLGQLVPPPPSDPHISSTDFHTTLYWSAPPNQPPDTKYTVEYTELRNDWRQVEGCASIKTRSCELSAHLEDPHELYWLRVKATWKEETSNWSEVLQFQPYRDTNVSTPNFTLLSSSSETIQIAMHLPAVPFTNSSRQKVKKTGSFYSKLRCNINLYQRGRSWKDKAEEEPESVCRSHTEKAGQMDNLMQWVPKQLNREECHRVTFVNLTPNVCYCVKVMFSAPYKDSPLSQEQCIFLYSKSSASIWHIMAGLISLLLLLILLAALRLVKGRRMLEDQFPKTLMVLSNEGMVDFPHKVAEMDSAGDHISFLSDLGNTLYSDQVCDTDDAACWSERSAPDSSGTSFSNILYTQGFLDDMPPTDDHSESGSNSPEPEERVFPELLSIVRCSTDISLCTVRLSACTAGTEESAVPCLLGPNCTCRLSCHGLE
ncbi:interleukin-20 receptor subunit alpha-like [Polypterus senegalus]|uniref:interleukin-20 receptor subunit alpha-like n=1 Tax=Polypterus senegalus TaxID=55291 RepID=UPI00196687CD|nr:interleukin-20 receptor subunit alpha-like [Polypterus senegalus]